MATKPKDYRALKKQLNKYHSFSFAMPRKGRDFTPQQKAALTRKANQLGDVIKSVRGDRASFVNYPKKSKLPGVDGIRTNKGVFFKFPGAKAVKIKITDANGRTRQKYSVATSFKKMRELLIPFPKSILGNMDLIIEFVQDQESIYKPDYIMWSVNGNKARHRYVPEVFTLYAQGELAAPDGGEADDGLPYYIGVFFGWAPN